MKKKLLAGTLAVMLVLSLGTVALADLESFSVIDGFGSQIVTGDADLEIRATLYNVRSQELTALVKIEGVASTGYDIDVYVYDTSSEEEIGEFSIVNQETDAEGEWGGFLVVPNVAAMPVEFALSGDVTLNSP